MRPPRTPELSTATDLLVDSFEIVASGRGEDVLRLAVLVPCVLAADARPTLVVVREAAEDGATERGFSPRESATGPGDPLQWLATFALPAQIARDPSAEFALWLYDAMALSLPLPTSTAPTAQLMRLRRSVRPTLPYGARRTALAVLMTCQLCVLPGWTASGALADGGTPGTPTEQTQGEGQPSSETPPATPQGEESPSSEPPVEAPSEQPPVEQPPTEQPPEEKHAGEGPPAEQPSNPPSGQPSPKTTPGPKDEGPSESRQPSSAPAAAGKAPEIVAATKPAAPQVPSHAVPAQPSHRHAGVSSPAPRRHHSKPDSSSTRVPHQRTNAASSTTEAPTIPVVPAEEGLSQLPSELASLASGMPGGLEDAPPSYLIPIYQEAGRRYGVPWTVLAAINKIETDYGRDLAVSSAGALGWMQFMPETWREWGVDANHDGQADPYSPLDAIFTAARYLQASGAAHDLPGAVFAYNHADWYVAEVLLRAHTLGDTATLARVERGYALPLDARYMHTLGRTDDGVDIETAPDGALVYSMTSGVVTAVASDPGGFGPNYPVIEATDGALAGRHIYYGHVAAALVTVGQKVSAGQPIALIGHTGDATSIGHGHIEIGFCDAAGDPLNHHGADAWTPAGDVMRGILVGLSGAFGIHND
jgi:murein DD-endopeptidase MepM/ murein hydrolase activator NlpD